MYNICIENCLVVTTRIKNFQIKKFSNQINNGIKSRVHSGVASSGRMSSLCFVLNHGNCFSSFRSGCKVLRLFVSCRSSFASITTTLPAKNVLLLVPTYQQRYYCSGKMQLVKDTVLSTSLMSTHICCSANNPWSMDFFLFIQCLH